MALRDKPYLPLYVQDYLTDEKLRECKSSSVGIYSFLLCVMHKSDEYGIILLKQKDKQTDNQIKNFALKLLKHLPYDLLETECALIDLCDEKVLQIDGDRLIQKRMVRDNKLSEIRSETGSKGGKKTQNKNKEFAKAKVKANTDTDNDIENENVFEKEKGITKGKNKFTPPKIEQVIEYCNERHNSVDPVKWLNFYQAKDWMIGKNKMKDWKAAVRTWENNNSNQINGTGKQKQQFSNNSNSGVSDDYKKSILKRLGVTGSAENM